MRGGQDGLRPALDGECSGGGEDRDDGEGDAKARGPEDVGALNDTHAEDHENSAPAYLKERERAEVDARREVGEG